MSFHFLIIFRYLVRLRHNLGTLYTRSKSRQPTRMRSNNLLMNQTLSRCEESSKNENLSNRIELILFDLY